MNLWTYFFFGDSLVCDNALPATDLVLALVLPSLNRDEALRATDEDVCLLLLLAINNTSFQYNQGTSYDALISDCSLHGTETNFPHCGHLSVTSTSSFGSFEISKALRPQLEHFIFFIDILLTLIICNIFARSHISNDLVKKIALG